jgi:glutaredoxin 3
MTATPKIELYGTEFCSFCAAARMLLKKKGLDWDEIRVSGNSEARREMEAKSGRRTVPQIFIGGQPIGGFDELYELDRSGDLDRMLGRVT